MKIYLTTLFFLPVVFVSNGQFIDKLYVGYNTFNEVYAGIQIPKKSLNKFTFETGYQFALKSEAHYTYSLGPFNIPNPFLTNNAAGIRLRAGYQLNIERYGYAALQFEYQNLQSNKFIYDPDKNNGSTRFPSAYSEFTESYSKYGVRLSNGIPFENKSFYFVVAPAFFYMDVHRKYSVEGNSFKTSPSTREEEFHKLSLQITFGLRIYLNLTKN